MRTAQVALAAVTAGLLLQGCALAPAPEAPEYKRDLLLDGRFLFGLSIEADDSDVAEILQMSADMEAFVESHVADAPNAGTRLRRLLAGMIEEGYLDLVYDPGVTSTAAQTFATRSGNCLSFTNLFVAMARHAGLEVAFQIVQIPPVWDAQGQWIILDKHINTIVSNVRVGVFHQRDYVVDFNIADYQGNYRRKRVSDEHAYALYFSNLGVEKLRAGQAVEAFGLLKRAITLNPDIAAPWINLGALYSNNQLFDAAISAYQIALELEPGNRSALVNLARLYATRDDTERAAYYEARIRHYRERNPYFHFQRALQDYKDGNWLASQGHLRRALAIKTDEHQFHFLAALNAIRMEEPEKAIRSLSLALKHAHQDQVRKHYAAKLSGLVED